MPFLDPDHYSARAMPSTLIHPPDPYRSLASEYHNALPQLLQTPSGLALLEIQGSINAPPKHASIGQLVFPLYNPSLNGSEDNSWHKKVHLYVGKYQRMAGEVKKLGKPIAVLRRRNVEREEEKEQGEQLEIVEIVYYKLLFAQRPEPVGGGAEDG